MIMWKSGNWFVFTAFGIIAIGIGIYCLDVILSADKQQSTIVNSFQKLVVSEDYCRTRHTNVDSNACNCSKDSSLSLSFRQNGNDDTQACPPVPVLINGSRDEDMELANRTTKTSSEGSGPWYAEDRLWHYPAKFPRCSMDACFNYSRCENMEDIRIFNYDVPGSPGRYFASINSTKWWTNDPGQACLLLVYLDTANPWAQRDPRQLPYWNGGMNHVLVTFADKWWLKRVPDESVGFASLLISDMHETIYRPGFDISIPLPPRHRLTQFQQTKPMGRKYLLTFRGVRYLGSEHLEGSFRSHQSFRSMHNGRDVIVAVSCRHPTNNRMREADPSLASHCDEDQAIYDSYNYVDLMNSTFALAPAGRQPNSYRFSEILSAGSIPVLIADNYVKPFDTLVQWHRCILQFPTSQMHRILPVLRRITEDEAVQRQEYCLKVYNAFFRDDQTLLASVVLSLKARMMGFFPNVTSAMQL